MPEAIPVTTPVVLTEPSVGLLLLQVPPVVVSPRAVVRVVHTFMAPVRAAGCRLTLIGSVAVQPEANV